MKGALQWRILLLVTLSLTFLYSDSLPAQMRRFFMVEEIERQFPINHPSVREAMLTVPRHLFVPPKHRDDAYRIIPIPIGYSQTISAPDIVSIMTDLLNLNENSRVLEIGTGSGYQAAVVGQITKQVYSIEIIPELADESRMRLNSLGYDYITTKQGDGYYGWPEYAPYDGIIVTAAADHIPPSLLSQLALGGVMVIPVGPSFGVQRLLQVNKDLDGHISRREILLVRFVPFVHPDSP